MMSSVFCEVTLESRFGRFGDFGDFLVSSSLYVSHMFVTRVLWSLVFQSCPSLELVSPLQGYTFTPVWDLLLPLA